MNFDAAFERLIGHEGGYVAHPEDPGGETKYGISKRSYPNEDIKHLTLERAKAIYESDYWKAAGCEIVPEHVRFDLFDMAVNSSGRTAIKTLQAAAGVTPDGIIGHETLTACSVMDGSRLLARLNGARLAYMTRLSTWPSFGRGWANRIAANLMEI